MSETRYLFVYILKCSDNTYYTGITNNPERRIDEHNSGENKNSYTAQRLPVEMIYCEKFTDFNLAIVWEKKIKDWSRKKKEALIRENWDQIKILAACKNYSSHKNLVDLNETVLDGVYPALVLVPIAIGTARTDTHNVSASDDEFPGETVLVPIAIGTARTDIQETLSYIEQQSSSNDINTNA